MSFSFKWDNKVAGREREAAISGLDDAIEFLLEAANRTIPHDEGVMQDSGATSVDESALEATVFYDTPYAVKQHEDMTLRHAKGRRAKWLEATMQEQHGAVQKYLADEIRRVLGG